MEGKGELGRGGEGGGWRCGKNGEKWPRPLKIIWKGVEFSHEGHFLKNIAGADIGGAS